MATNSGVLYIPPRVKQHKGRRHYRNSGGCSAVRSLSNGTQLWCNGVKDHEGKHWAAYRRPTKKVPHPKIIEWTTPTVFSPEKIFLEGAFGWSAPIKKAANMKCCS